MAELELGFELTDNMILTANVYDIRISNPIIYFFDQVQNLELYKNFDQTGSQGFEIDYRYKSVGNFIGANFSYYTSKNINEVPIYEVPGEEGLNLAWPNAKVNVYGSFRFLKKLTINPTVTFASKRFGFTQFDTNDELILEEFAPQTFFNLYINYTNALTEGLTLGAGVYDILDEGQVYIQPYRSGHPPLPGIGREILVRVSYTIPFKGR